VKTKIKHVSLIAAVLTVGASCESFDGVKKRVNSTFELGKGVPLSEFKAEDRKYFPKFLKNFFPRANDFERKNSTLNQAATDIKVIEVKKLNKSGGRHNEANLSWSADGVYLGYEVIDAEKRQILVKDLGDNYSNVLLKLPKEKKNSFLEGMTRKAIFSYNAGLRWSEDSTRFAFMSNGGVGEYNIYVGAVGSEEKVIAKSPSKEGFAAWNPRKSEIAFVSSRSGNGDIYMVDAYGVGVNRLSKSDDVDIFPDWFPNGNALIYSSGDALNHDLVLVQRVKGKWGRPLKITNWSADELRPIVSPDGKFIAFYADSPVPGNDGTKSWNLYVIPTRWLRDFKLPLKAGVLRTALVARNVMVDINTGPAFSPDSSKIFYVKKASRILNPIEAYDLASGKNYRLNTNTRMNRDVMVSRLGVLSFRAQEGAWDRVYLALTNQGDQLQKPFKNTRFKIKYLK
jgi:Tol biopolymer transport system component